MDANEILSVTDVLISDYSSIFFDYLNTGKPVVFYIPDAGSFEEYRGVYASLENLPGPTAATLEEVGKIFKDLSAAVKPYQPAGNSARRMTAEPASGSQILCSEKKKSRNR